MIIYSQGYFRFQSPKTSSSKTKLVLVLFAHHQTQRVGFVTVDQSLANKIVFLDPMLFLALVSAPSLLENFLVELLLIFELIVLEKIELCHFHFRKLFYQILSFGLFKVLYSKVQ